MRKATDFMMTSVSRHGGFVWKYSADLSEQWGEAPARPSMIWVQDPGTVGVGMMLLDAYAATGDAQYLAYAKKAANALIWGQHPAGGWHYFIDFDAGGVQKWYDDVLSKCWGWEEYYHYYGNCTFDDNVSTGATRFLMELYMTTLEPQYRTPLLAALGFILASQYPNGAWPQRYPLKDDFSFGGRPDYTSYYTLNDDVTRGNIFLLLEAHARLGNEKYKAAAHRGMDFIVLSQLTKPQAGWAQQYDKDLKPVAARSIEPAAVMSRRTVTCIRDLMTFYRITGNRKYLSGIPDAIAWLESSYLPKHHKMNDRVTHATFYEPGMNKPLYAHAEGTGIENGRCWIDYNPKNLLAYYGMQHRIDVAALKKEYERIKALTPEKATEEYRSRRGGTPAARKGDTENVTKLMQSLDKRGAWTEEIRIPDFDDVVNNPQRKLIGISTATYLHNMKTMIRHLRTVREKK